MTIRRAPKPEREFRLARNSVSRDNRISLAAHGLLDYLLSFPDDWEFGGEEGIAKQVKDGVTAVRSALKELEKAGYLHRKRYRTDDGKFRWTWTLFDVPRMPDLSILSLPTCGQTTRREPRVENLSSYEDCYEDCYEDVSKRSVLAADASSAEDSDSKITDVRGQNPSTDEQARTSWRDQDRQRFADLMLVKTINSDGCDLPDGTRFNRGTFTTSAVYDGLRRIQVDGKPMDWPGRYLESVDEVGQLDEWLEYRGLRRDWDSITGSHAAA